MNDNCGGMCDKCNFDEGLNYESHLTAVKIPSKILETYSRDNNTSVDDLKIVDESHGFVVWSDPGFGEAVSRALECPYDHVRVEDLLDIDSLEIFGDFITLRTSDTAIRLERGSYQNYVSGLLTGLHDLHWFPNLHTLMIWFHNFESLNGIENLDELRELSLVGNGISDITAISKLILLRAVDLKDNDIENTTALASLIYVGKLILSNNKVADISALRTMKFINTLYLDGNNITNIEALRNLRFLRYLQLDQNKIGDRGVDVLSRLTSLTELYLCGCSITNISGFGQLSDLRQLDLKNNRIKDFTS